MENVRIRMAVLDDINELIRIRLIFGEELSGVKNHPNEQLLVQSLKEYLEKELGNKYLVWLAVIDNEIISTAAVCIREQPGSFLNTSGIWGYVMNVYTFPKYRKMGLADKLMKTLIDECRQNGIGALDLHASELGKSCYEKLDFKLHDQPYYRLYL